MSTCTDYVALTKYEVSSPCMEVWSDLTMYGVMKSVQEARAMRDDLSPHQRQEAKRIRFGLAVPKEILTQTEMSSEHSELECGARGLFLRNDQLFRAYFVTAKETHLVRFWGLTRLADIISITAMFLCPPPLSGIIPHCY